MNYFHSQLNQSILSHVKTMALLIFECLAKMLDRHNKVCTVLYFFWGGKHLLDKMLV